MTLVYRDTYQLTKALLSLIGAGVEIGKELVLSGYRHTSQDKELWEKVRKSRIRSAIKRLENQKLLSWNQVNGDIKLVLTDKGKKKVLQYSINELKIKKTPKGDGYFRVIIFDIRENKKSAREIFRKKLKELEFKQLQRSVFVSPYECREEIDFLKNVYGLAPYVSYILAKEIPDITFDPNVLNSG